MLLKGNMLISWYKLWFLFLHIMEICYVEYDLSQMPSLYMTTPSLQPWQVIYVGFLNYLNLLVWHRQSLFDISILTYTHLDGDKLIVGVLLVRNNGSLVVELRSMARHAKGSANGNFANKGIDNSFRCRPETSRYLSRHCSNGLESLRVRVRILLIVEATLCTARWKI